MVERSERPVEPVRLVLDDGDVVEVDGSRLWDAGAEREVPAVVVRMPPHRALWFAEVMDRMTRVSALLASSGEWSVVEGSFAWALHSAALATGDREAAAAVEQQGAASRQRLRVAAVLRERTGLSDPQLVAVVDAAARWLAEERGADYAWALLEAVSRDEETTRLAFRALTGQPPAGVSSG